MRRREGAGLGDDLQEAGQSQPAIHHELVSGGRAIRARPSLPADVWMKVPLIWCARHQLGGAGAELKPLLLEAGVRTPAAIETSAVDDAIVDDDRAHRRGRRSGWRIRPARALIVPVFRERAEVA